MKSIQMVDLQGQYLRIKNEIDNAISSVISQAAFIQGPQVKSFSSALASYTQSPFVTTCANGTDALQIAMMALNLKPGDEVILPVHTYVATAEVIALLGLKPVFVDVRQDHFNIDPSKLKSVLTPKTKAIVPVHLYGQCAPMEEILTFAAEHKLFVIEDTAQALGAVYTFKDGRRKFAGTMGTIGTTSFFPSKNLGCFGDGGAMFTADPELAGRLQMIANHGQKKKYYHECVGVNSRLDTLQAAILEVKLRHLPTYERSRQEAAAFYDSCLSGLGEVVTPVRMPYTTHVYHQYTLKVQRRDELKSYLESRGIPTMIYYPVPLHEQVAYKQHDLAPGSFPMAEQLSKSVLSLPMHTELDRETMEYICASIKTFYHG
ncbi:MAG: DegT/DnrJ/EryC1/StrS family aminotransferase [Cyclobacteriaceae bacterium]